MSELFSLLHEWDLFGSYPEPPDLVPLRLLGLAEMPDRRDGIGAAFTRQVKPITRT